MGSGNGTEFILPNVTGRVEQILPPFKAIIKFTHWGREHEALLWSENIQICNIFSDKCLHISKYLKVGDTVLFDCLQKKKTNNRICDWEVTKASKIFIFEPKHSFQIITGVKNSSAVVTKISKNEGVLIHTTDNGRIQEIFFFKTSVYINLKRLQMKDNLKDYLSIDDQVKVDAVPTNPEYNPLNCPLFALVVWTGEEKPFSIDYQNEIGNSIIRDIGLFAVNPDSNFIHGTGLIAKIINSEYGILMGQVQDTFRWVPVLFHRFSAFAFGQRLETEDLSKVFVKNDRVTYLAVGFNRPTELTDHFKWVAVKVSFYVPKEFNQ